MTTESKNELITTADELQKIGKVVCLMSQVPTTEEYEGLNILLCELSRMIHQKSESILSILKN